jgi:hypothetical protein
MKANELMIGDWVKFPGGTIDKIVDLPYVPGMGICARFAIGSSLSPSLPFSVDKIEPIPITPEILEKNGFVNKKGRFMQKGNFDDPPLILWHLIDDKILGHPKSQLEIHHGKESMHVSLVCIYVHELQHALRLCKINKEIIL